MFGVNAANHDPEILEMFNDVFIMSHQIAAEYGLTMNQVAALRDRGELGRFALVGRVYLFLRGEVDRLAPIAAAKLAEREPKADKAKKGVLRTSAVDVAAVMLASVSVGGAAEAAETVAVVDSLGAAETAADEIDFI